MAAGLAFGATYVVVALSGPWSRKRYLAHLGVVAVGLGVLYLVVMITLNTPSCPDTASRVLLGSLGPQSCPG